MKPTSLVCHLGQIDLEEPAEAQIHQKLRTAILRLDLPPGATVSEAEIARAVGVSRTPVRAALAMLRNEGLIFTLPSRGNKVTLLDPKAIREAQFIRDALEQAVAATLCREGIAPEVVHELNEILKRGLESVETHDSSEFHRLDDKFHAVLGGATGHARLPKVLEREKSLLDRLRFLSLSDAAYQRELLQEHKGILAAIVARDEVAARGAVSSHLGRVLTTLSELKERHTAFFETSTHLKE